MSHSDPWPDLAMNIARMVGHTVRRTIRSAHDSPVVACVPTSGMEFERAMYQTKEGLDHAQYFALCQCALWHDAVANPQKEACM